MTESAIVGLIGAALLLVQGAVFAWTHQRVLREQRAAHATEMQAQRDAHEKACDRLQARSLAELAAHQAPATPLMETAEPEQIDEDWQDPSFAYPDQETEE